MFESTESTLELKPNTEVVDRPVAVSDEKDFALKHQLVRKFEVDESLINDCERAEEVCFEPLSLKRTIDQWIAEVDTPEQFDWTVQSNTDEIRIWTRTRGLQSAPDLPLIQVEYYFPDIEDPRILQAAILNFRHRFDINDKESVEEVEAFGNGNTVVHHMVGKPIVIAARDSVEKRLFFKAAEALTNMNENEMINELGSGDTDDFYAWVTDVPEKAHPPPEGVVRIERLYGFNMISRIMNLPEVRRGQHTKGCYFHEF